MSNRPDEQPTDETSGCLPAGQDNTGGSENLTYVFLPKEASHVEQLLPAPDGEASREREAEGVSQPDIEADHKFLNKHVNRKPLTAREKQFAAERLSRDRAALRQKYRFKRKWLARKASVDPTVLAKAIKEDPEVKELRHYIGIGSHARKARLKEAMLTEQPKLMEKVLAIQAEIDPVVQTLIELDRRMRLAQQRVDELVYRANHIVPPNDYYLQAKLKVRIKQITDSLMRQKLEYDVMALRKAHGHWSPTNMNRRRIDSKSHKKSRTSRNTSRNTWKKIRKEQTDDTNKE